MRMPRRRNLALRVSTVRVRSLVVGAPTASTVVNSTSSAFSLTVSASLWEARVWILRVISWVWKPTLWSRSPIWMASLPSIFSLSVIAASRSRRRIRIAQSTPMPGSPSRMDRNSELPGKAMAGGKARGTSMAW